MIRISLAAAAALSLAAPAIAQSTTQSELDDRYDRALAAGYKAMFLCSALANAERAGGSRTPEHVMQWELTGIQAPLDELIADMPYEIVRGENGVVTHVGVEWADEMPPRLAAHRSTGGCSIIPIGMTAYDISPRVVTAPVEGEHEALAHSAPPAVLTAIGAAFQDSYGADSRTTAVVVSSPAIEAGYVERYADGFGPNTPQRTWSVAKSIAATLVGAAVQRGDVDVSESAGLGASDADPRKEITIDNALRMATGRYSDTPGNRTDSLYFGGATVDEVAVDWPLLNRPAGSVLLEHTFREDGSLISFQPPQLRQWGVFRYANNDTLAAVQAIEHTFEAYPPSALFAALGMHRTIAETDWRGNYILSSQVWSTARDLARLGQLHLDDGVLPDGTRVLPEGWVDYVSSPSGPQPGNTAWGYGAGWWTMDNIDGIPGDAFAARGNRGQYVVVIPSENLVIVRRGEDPAGGSGFDIIAFTTNVLAALQEPSQ